MLLLLSTPYCFYFYFADGPKFVVRPKSQYKNQVCEIAPKDNLIERHPS